MSVQSTFHHRPLESTLHKRRQHRQLGQLRQQAGQVPILKYIFIIIILGLIVFFWKSPWFYANIITCSTQFSSTCEEAVLAELEQGKGRHLFFGSWEKEIENIQRANPSYAEFSRKRRFPSKIEFTVTLSPPRYILIIHSQEQLITEAGAVVHTTFPEHLPKFLIAESVATQIEDSTVIPDYLHKEFLTVAQCLSQTPTQLDSIEWLSNSEIILSLANDRKALIKAADCSSQIQQLQTVLQYPLETEWTEVDLRFSKPILR